MTALSPIYQKSLNEALVLARDWIPAWLMQLYAALEQREAATVSPLEKQLLGQSRRALQQHRDMVATRFLEALGRALSGELTPQSLQGPRSLQALSFDELELMDDRQVNDTVELARVQQLVRMSADEALVGLSARLSAAQGLSVIRHEANPLRPDVVVAALMQALRTMHLDEAVRTRWLHAGAVSLGEQLQAYYQELSRRLDRWGIEPASYAVVQSPAAKAGVARAAGVSASPRAESVTTAAVPGQAPVLTLDHLHQLLVGNLEHPDAAGETGNAMTRTLAAEVVSQLLRRIADDHRLLPTVREMIERLKPALLELARTDPRFFADRQNPARRLLDLITARGLAFTSDQDSTFAPFALSVMAVVQGLEAPGTQLSQRFAQQLQQLEQALAADAGSRGRAVQSLVRAEQRNLMAKRVAHEIEGRNDFARVPGVVRRFLQGPWAQVVAQARLDAEIAGGASPRGAAAQRYMDILPDLLWSAQIVQASRNRPRLIKLIPALLKTLREGLESIDYPRTQSEGFFQALMGLHEAAYKAVPTEAGDSIQSRHSHSGYPDEASAWLQPAEARDTGFIDDLTIETQPDFLETEPMPMPRDLADVKADQAREQGQVPLSVGAWVDLLDGDRVVRCQLTWASPHATMFLFHAVDGRTISLTRRGLDRLLASSRLHVVADHGVVDDALDNVARQAAINSGQSRSGPH